MDMPAYLHALTPGYMIEGTRAFIEADTRSQEMETRRQGKTGHLSTVLVFGGGGFLAGEPGRGGRCAGADGGARHQPHRCLADLRSGRNPPGAVAER